MFYSEKLDEIQLEYAKRIIKEQATIGQYSTNLSIKIGTNVIDTLKNEGFNITKGMITYKVSWKDIVTIGKDVVLINAPEIYGGGKNGKTNVTFD